MYTCKSVSCIYMYTYNHFTHHKFAGLQLRTQGAGVSIEGGTVKVDVAIHHSGIPVGIPVALPPTTSSPAQNCRARLGLKLQLSVSASFFLCALLCDSYLSSGLRVSLCCVLCLSAAPRDLCLDLLSTSLILHTHTHTHTYTHTHTQTHTHTNTHTHTPYIAHYFNGFCRLLPIPHNTTWLN